MKTIVMRDIIEAVATREQLLALTDELTWSQYYDLMNNNGTGGDADQIGVLSVDHTDGMVYLTALEKVTGKSASFWKNANTLILAVNADIKPSDRERFHVDERIIDPKLITLLENGVPTKEEALDLVTEVPFEGRDVLTLFLKGVDATENDSVTVRIPQISDQQLNVRLVHEFFALRYQPKNAFLLYILNQFRKQGVKTITIGKEVLSRLIEPLGFVGYAEADMRASVMTTGHRDADVATESHMLFPSVIATRELSEVEARCPATLTLTIDEEAWYILTSPCMLER